MLLTICNNSTVLAVIRIVKIVIRLITIIVPIILILSSMITLVKELKEGGNDLVGKSLKSIATKSIAAILIFFIPTFASIIVNISSDYAAYKACINGATREGVAEARYKEARELIEMAKKDVSMGNYQVALSKINRIRDQEVRQELLDELSEVINLLDLKEEVNENLTDGTESNYNDLLSKVNNLEDSEFKNSLLDTLAKMRERLDNEGLGNVVKVLSNITTYPPKKGEMNSTVNYYAASTGQKFTFWLYLPDKMKSNLPIVLYIHGLDGRGDDYNNDTTAAIWGGPIREVLQKSKSWDAILVHMQVPYQQFSQDYIKAFHELLDKLADGFKADKKRISIMGFSNGCYGLWYMISNYQNYFSAAVPIGCSSAGVNPNIFKTTPMWSLVGSGDGADTLPSFAETVNGLNGNSKHSNSKYYQHNCIYPADYEGVLLEYDVVEWMISQKRK